MNTILLRFVRVVLLAGLAAATQLSAQTPAQLDVQTYAGLTITGTTGVVYSIEYVTDLAQTNDPTAWRCLEFLQLPANPYLWVDKSAPATSKRFYRAKEFPPPTNMVFIPPGTFRMGSPTNEVDRAWWEGPQTDVIISRGYWIGEYEVTQGEYLAVVGTNPSFVNGVRYNGNLRLEYGTDLQRPVEQVTWYDANAFCSALTEQERATGRIPTNCVCRLPTEAEWEYACRAGTSTRFSYGDDPGYTNLTDYAWYGSVDPRGSTQAVGKKLPNPWGLYDMYGNVAELCQDWFALALAGGLALDPQGPALDPLFGHRVIRGGSFYTPAAECRSAHRSSVDPVAPLNFFIGIRVVLSPGPP